MQGKFFRLFCIFLIVQIIIICFFCFEKVNAPKYFLFAFFTALLFLSYTFFERELKLFTFDKVFFLLLLAFSASLISARDKVWASQHLFSLVTVFACYFVVSKVYSTKNYRFLLSSLVALGVVEVIQATYQLSMANADGYIHYLKSYPFSVKDFILPKFIYNLRPLGSFGNPNPLSLFMVISLIGALALFSLPERDSKTLQILVPGILSFGIVLTQSRSGIIELILSLIIWSILNAKQRGKLIECIPMYGGILAGVFLGLLLVRFFTGELEVLRRMAATGAEYSTRQRLWFWLTGLFIFVKNPLLGVGLGNVKLWTWLYGGELLRNAKFSTFFLPHVSPLGVAWLHNEFIHFVAETGIIGLLAMSVFLFWIIRMLKFVCKKRMEEAGFLLPFFVTYGVDALFNMPLHHPSTLFLFAIVLGILVSLSGSELQRPVYTSRVTITALRVGAVFLLLVNFTMLYSGYYLSRAKEMILKGDNKNVEKYVDYVNRSMLNPVVARLTFETLEPYYYYQAMTSCDREAIRQALVFEHRYFTSAPMPLTAYKIYELYLTTGDLTNAERWWGVVKKMYPLPDDELKRRLVEFLRK